MFVLVTSLCLAFSDGDIEFDFVLMTIAYSQYLRHRQLASSIFNTEAMTSKNGEKKTFSTSLKFIRPIGLW